MILSGNLKLTDYEEIDYIYSCPVGIGFLILMYEDRGKLHRADEEGGNDLLCSNGGRSSD